MNIDWITSFEALRSVYQDEAYSNIAINEAISRHKGCRDSFVRSLVKETIRSTITLDMIIDGLASSGIRSIKQRTLIVLRMGICAIRSMDSVPDHAAVNEAVSLARKVAKGTDRFVNAVLRSYLRSAGEIEKNDSPEFRFGFPAGIIELISEQYGSETEKILDGLNSHPPLVIRVNRLKTGRDELIEKLVETGINAYPADADELAVITEGNNLIGTDLYRDGLFTVQSLSSISAIRALAPERGSRVLDMCAAPGGKTCMMAELMDNEGSITACDIHEHRLELIRSTAARMGSEIIDTVPADGTVHNPEWDGRFDYVLADVPCSGLGVIGSKPEIRFRTDPAAYRELYTIQEAILENAGKYVRPGGLIEYSTCTINKEENERLVLRTLEHMSSLSIVEMRTFLPYNCMVGFYYCILKKNAAEA